MSETPLVTVYIPSYNRRALLERAVNSVLNQTYTNLEVIIVDDCSPDDTLDYLAEIAKKDSRIRYFQNEKNSGACVSRNKAIMEAKGEFITGLDDDDYFLPERIVQFVTQWPTLTAKHPDMVCLFSNVLVKRDASENAKLTQYKKPKIVKQKDLLISNFIGNQVFTKTESLRQVMFDENLPMWQDLDCWYRLLNMGNALNANVVGYVLDVSHPHERISTKKNDSILMVIDVLSEKYNLSIREKSIIENQIFAYGVRELTLGVLLVNFSENRSFFAFYYLLRKFLKNKLKN